MLRVFWVGVVLGTPVWSLVAAEPNGLVHLQVIDDGERRLVPARVHLTDPSDKPVKVPGLPFYRDHFNCDGEVVIELSPGKYRFTVERGPEYDGVEGDLDVKSGKTTNRKVFLTRLLKLSGLGWYSGDLHIHRPLDDVPLLIESEDLNIAPVLTVWNQRNRWRDRPLPKKLLNPLGENRWIHQLACEDERQGGALLYLNVETPLDFEGDGSEFPSPLKHLRVARDTDGVWIDIEKPFWWDVPTWLATGRIDSIGIANNHMCRKRMYPDEAWGRPRDVDRLPSPRGNGFYSQELYYRILDCGFKVPPSAGSASGVLPNPIGYNRVYVHLDEPFTYQAWWRGLRAGRSFVTNGPLLLVRVDGRHPGETFKIAAGERFKPSVDVQVFSSDPLESLEIVVNGVVVRRVERPVSGETLSLAGVEFDRSGWVLVRCIADVANTFRFASTAPFFVDIESTPPRIDPEDVQFFIDWIRERKKRISEGATETIGDLSQSENAARLRSVMGPHDEALRIFERLLKSS